MNQKVKKKGFERLRILQICYVVNFFRGADHIAFDLDQDFKVGSDVVFDVAAEHVSNLSIVLNS